ncbi:polysaccharide biosynthesis protein [Rubritalea sp.]|uniref:polysaccharide biosynthesis protein n=1 Tax=Rubritalea sp. TaxID=2109375 RepID=UPI003EF0982E
MSKDKQKLLKSILGRSESFLKDDLERSSDQIQEQLFDARVLVIGAAGSIGSAFVRELTRYSFKALHLLDISENNLVEVVRDLRAGAYQLPKDFKTFSIDFGSTEMQALLASHAYEYVLNFSALKHVRAERDPFTLMRLLQVNVLSNNDLLDWLSDMTSLRRVFSVSSDKSVRPANLMGASKALMERVFLHRADVLGFTSARFANVAFSDGSLLQSFENRLAKKQPLSAPSDVRRYFITEQEAGQLCLLACFTGENREIFFPKFDPERDMKTFAEIARLFLQASGYEPIEFNEEQQALAFMRSRSEGDRRWACNFSTSDTSGEKLYEEFNDPEEPVELERFKNVGIVLSPKYHSDESVIDAVRLIRAARASGTWGKEELLKYVQTAVPELEHREADKNLDQKM